MFAAGTGDAEGLQAAISRDLSMHGPGFIAQVLLDKQANPNALDYQAVASLATWHVAVSLVQGNSALTYAQDFNHMKVVEKLIAADAS